jgi:hypothetical protein
MLDLKCRGLTGELPVSELWAVGRRACCCTGAGRNRVWCAPSGFSPRDATRETATLVNIFGGKLLVQPASARGLLVESSTSTVATGGEVTRCAHRSASRLSEESRAVCDAPPGDGARTPLCRPASLGIQASQTPSAA